MGALLQTPAELANRLTGTTILHNQTTTAGSAAAPAAALLLPAVRKP